MKNSNITALKLLQAAQCWLKGETVSPPVMEEGYDCDAAAKAFDALKQVSTKQPL